MGAAISRESDAPGEENREALIGVVGSELDVLEDARLIEDTGTSATIRTVDAELSTSGRDAQECWIGLPGSSSVFAFLDRVVAHVSSEEHPWIERICEQVGSVDDPSRGGGE